MLHTRLVATSKLFHTFLFIVFFPLSTFFWIVGSLAEFQTLFSPPVFDIIGSKQQILIRFRTVFLGYH